MSDCFSTTAPLRGVVIGGGTGAPASIKALLNLGMDTTAVVAMADDGGSTGLLRVKADVTPPGDIRKCLIAMAEDPTDPLTQAFRTRFQFADNHAVGNLLLVALEGVTGSFPEAIEICARLINARGHVHPSTLSHVWLNSTARNGHTMEGQAEACHSDIALDRVWLHSDEEIVAHQPAIDAIRQADVIILGPGSLFTSIIPNLLVPGVIDAIKDSKAPTLFVCSLADFQGETWHMTAEEHLQALFNHGMEDLVDYMLVHDSQNYPLPGNLRPVCLSDQAAQHVVQAGVILLRRNVANADMGSQHDIDALSRVIQEVLDACRSPKR